MTFYNRCCLWYSGTTHVAHMNRCGFNKRGRRVFRRPEDELPGQDLNLE